MPREQNGSEIAAVRREQALEMRVQGWSFRAIAKELGVGTTTVFKYIQAELADLADDTRESAEELREVELQRIDVATKLCMGVIASEPGAKEPPGDDDGLVEPEDTGPGVDRKLRAIDRLVKLSDSRSKLLGLYAPQEVNTKVVSEVTPADIRESLRRNFGGNVAPKIEEPEQGGGSSDPS